MAKIGKLFFVLIIIINSVLASDSLTVYGRIIDTSGVGIADAKIITEDGVISFSDENGNYMINISKDYVPIDHQDIVVNTISDYSVKIYNLLGQKIFDEKYQHSDFSQFAWNGLNKSGEMVSSGIYFSVLEVNNQIIARNKITVVGQEVLNKWPFMNASIQQIKIPNLLKSSDYNYDTKLSLEGENFTNISELTIKIEFNGNNDNAAEAEDIVLNTYEIDYIYDIDQNRYKVVKIGNQWWMAENLKVTHYRNGDPIPNGTDGEEWSNLTTGAYCYYDNSDSLGQIYGALYNWYAVDYECYIAPEGWHVPKDEEWEELAQFISDDNGGYHRYDTGRWKSVGIHLKSTSGWVINGNGTDDYGFAGFSSGCCPPSGIYNYLGGCAYFWSAMEVNSDRARYRYLHCSHNRFNLYDHYKEWGVSVRCVKDSE